MARRGDTGGRANGYLGGRARGAGRLLARGLLAVVVVAAGLAASGATAQPAAPKVFISVDMEGVTGTVQPAQLGPQGFEYGRAREWMTGEALAAIEAAKAAGAGEIVVADSHGNAQSLLLDALPPDVRVVRGFPRPLSMMQGIDATFQAAIFIGYHASEQTFEAVRGHTFSSARLLGVKLNGQEVAEGIFNAAIAGHFGVPVVFVSGDRPAVTQLQKVAPWVEGVIVKEPLGYHSALTLTPARGQALIRDGVRRALARLGQMQPYRVKTPIELEVAFKQTLDAERAAYIPGLVRSEAHAVRGTFGDIVQIAKLMQVLTSLEQP
jgi:D-amino peptidase